MNPIPSASTPPGDPTVYGVLLNDRATHARLGAAFHAPPYKAPPQAPVLYIKPRNTHAQDGATVRLPGTPGAVEINATLGLVMGRRATRVQAAALADYVAGYCIASDLSLPHESVYRPALRQRCRDGFLPKSATLAAPPGFDPVHAEAVTFVNGEEVDRRGFGALLRPPAQLVVDVTDFMTLQPGDVLLLGAADRSPLARPGDAVRIEVAGLGSLSYRVELDSEGAPA